MSAMMAKIIEDISACDAGRGRSFGDILTGHEMRLIARTVLLAARDPDEEMCLAACCTDGVANRFTAMIDVVLTHIPRRANA